MTELLTRRSLLRGLFAMPAVILTPKLLMPIRAFILPEPTWYPQDLDDLLAGIEEPDWEGPTTHRWAVQVLMQSEDGVDRFVGLVEDSDQPLLPPFKPGWRIGTEIDEPPLNRSA